MQNYQVLSKRVLEFIQPRSIPWSPDGAGPFRGPPSPVPGKMQIHRWGHSLLNECVDEVCKGFQEPMGPFLFCFFYPFPSCLLPVIPLSMCLHPGMQWSSMETGTEPGGCSEGTGLELPSPVWSQVLEAHAGLCSPRIVGVALSPWFLS